MNWNELTHSDQLQNIIELSNTKPVLVFKHSTRCGISRGVLSKFEQEMEGVDERIVFYYLDLLQYRNISNEIVSKFNVVHQSPQIILIKNGICY